MGESIKGKTEKVIEKMDFIFSPSILDKIDISDVQLADHLKMRPLMRTDRENNFLQVLAQLTKVGDIDVETFDARFDLMKASKMYFPLVVTDSEQNDIIVATATLILEQKFIRNCALKGRVEEVVVDQSARGMGLGKFLVTACTRLSEKLGVYKTTLECAPHNVKFYEKIGYQDAGETYM